MTQGAPSFMQLYRGELIAFLVAMTIAVISFFGMLWVNLIPPFGPESPKLLRGVDPYHASRLAPVEVAVTANCPFPLAVHVGLAVERTKSFAVLAFEAEEDQRNFWAMASRCEELGLHVSSSNSQPRIFVPDLQTGGFGIEFANKTPWNAMRTASVEEEQAISLEFSQGLRDELERLEFAGAIYVDLEQPGNPRTFSQSRLSAKLRLDSGETGNAVLKPYISVRETIDIDTVFPEPIEVEMDFPDVRQLALRDVRESVSIRVVYRDRERQALESILAVLFPALLGVGAAGVFQSISDALAIPRKSRIERLRRER